MKSRKKMKKIVIQVTKMSMNRSGTVDREAVYVDVVVPATHAAKVTDL